MPPEHRALLHQRLQVVLRQDEQRRADHRAVERAHAADDDDQQDVHHDGERERGLRPGVAQPERHQRAGQRRHHGGKAVGQGAVHHGAVAERLGAEIVLADGLQHAAEGRIDDAQQEQEQRQRREEHQVVGDQLAVDGRAENLGLDQAEAGPQHLRHAEGAAVLAAGEVRQLRSEHREGGGHRQRDHGVEDRPSRAARRGRSPAPAPATAARAIVSPMNTAPQVGPTCRARGRCRRRRCRRTWCGRRRRCRCSRAAGRRRPPARRRRRWWRRR
jgi:hypothetical protein